MKVLTEHPDYEILERCGQGGMGVVYRARDRRLNRIVALKFLIGAEHESDSRGAVQRFRREAEAIAALNHPAIATIFESGEWDGSPFLALEFLPGGTLRGKIHGTQLPLAAILDYTAQIASGLAYAHSKGILHRDIKTGNCMFSEHGVLKVMDFGLAKGIDTDGITQPGSPVGTIAYMAPEVLRGEPATVHSDLYSLGAVVYEMAARRPLYGGALGNLVQEVLAGSATPLAQIRPDLPGVFCNAVKKATALQPEDRFETVQEFAAALRITMPRSSPDTDSTPTVTISVPTSTPAPVRRPLWHSAAGAALLCVLLIAAIFAASRIGSRGPSAPGETMVVLPFENLGGDPANQSLCDGLQETVASVLSSAEEIRGSIMIVPSSEVRRSQIHTIAEARAQFKATLVIAGTAQKNGQDLQLTLDLTDARILRQMDSRILRIPAGATVGLQRQLADSLGTMLGSGPLLQRARRAGETTDNSLAYDLFLQGRGALVDRKYEGAADLLKRAVDADPEFALARAKLAEAYLRLNITSRDPKYLGMADAEVARASVTAGQSPEVLMAQALIRKANGNWQETINLFQEVIKRDPANMEAYRFLGETWDSAGHQKEAEDAYRKAVQLRPGYWPLYESLGNFYSLHQRFDLAIEALDKGIALAPDVPILYTDLGATYFRMSRWADAGSAFEKSIALKPTPYAYSNLGTVRFYEGNYAEAAKQMEAATRLQPANAINWGNLGDALWQISGNKKEAQAAFAKAADLAQKQLAINGNDARARKNYALYLAKLGRPADAAREARRAIVQAPADGGVQFYAARVYAVTGDVDAAFAALQQSLSLGYSAREIQQEPDFNALRNDPRYKQFSESQ